MGQIGNTSIIGEISMKPYISGQNSDKFEGRKFIDRGNSTGRRREKMFLQKLVFDIRIRCSRILKECWMLAQRCQVI